MTVSSPAVSAVDLFCGAGGLSAGLKNAGIHVGAGVDNDPQCAYPFERNIDAPFLERDIRDVSADHLISAWAPGAFKLLAGCAPCQPFSPYRRGKDTSSDERWPLLDEFSRLVSEIQPDFVTMENVPRIGTSSIFLKFANALADDGYDVSWKSCYAPRYGLPQHRRRLVLIASRHGAIDVPEGLLGAGEFITVYDVINDLPAIDHGSADPDDPIHISRRLSEKNLARIRSSSPGGTWRDWPPELRSPCHTKASGASFGNVYARMRWDEPSPTITTMSYNYGAGRFGHPEQDRPISLREAALLQGFPRDYAFVRPGDRPRLNHLGRLIGNAVPPPLAEAVGAAIVSHASTLDRTDR